MRHTAVFKSECEKRYDLLTRRVTAASANRSYEV